MTKPTGLTCGDCPWIIDGQYETWCSIRPNDLSVLDDNPECRARRAFRVLRDRYRWLKDDHDQIVAENETLIKIHGCKPCETEAENQRLREALHQISVQAVATADPQSRIDPAFTLEMIIGWCEALGVRDD